MSACRDGTEALASSIIATHTYLAVRLPVFRGNLAEVLPVEGKGPIVPAGQSHPLFRRGRRCVINMAAAEITTHLPIVLREQKMGVPERIDHLGHDHRLLFADDKREEFLVLTFDGIDFLSGVDTLLDDIVPYSLHVMFRKTRYRFLDMHMLMPFQCAARHMPSGFDTTINFMNVKALCSSRIPSPTTRKRYTRPRQKKGATHDRTTDTPSQGEDQVQGVLPRPDAEPVQRQRNHSADEDRRHR